MEAELRLRTGADAPEVAEDEDVGALAIRVCASSFAIRRIAASSKVGGGGGAIALAEATLSAPTPDLPVPLAPSLKLLLAPR